MRAGSPGCQQKSTRSQQVNGSIHVGGIQRGIHEKGTVNDTVNAVWPVFKSRHARGLHGGYTLDAG